MISKETIDPYGCQGNNIERFLSFSERASKNLLVYQISVSLLGNYQSYRVLFVNFAQIYLILVPSEFLVLPYVSLHSGNVLRVFQTTSSCLSNRRH